MRITEITEVEDCFDGSSTYRYAFDKPWTRADLSIMEPLGRLRYYPDFPRPFFQITGKTGLQVKGVAGETTCLVILPRRDREEIRRQFELSFERSNSLRALTKGAM